jgi:excisionase family DNA binding protein
MMIERQYRIGEAARITGHKESTWRKWILLRKVRFTKIGRSVRIPEGELARLINEGAVPPRQVRP